MPSRVERLLISKTPIAPKFAAMRRYLALRAGATVALAGVVHVAMQPVWDADLAQLGIAAPSDTVRVWIGVGFGVIAYYLMRMKRPWSVGKCSQLQLTADDPIAGPEGPLTSCHYRNEKVLVEIDIRCGETFTNLESYLSSLESQTTAKYERVPGVGRGAFAKAKSTPSSGWCTRHCRA